MKSLFANLGNPHQMYGRIDWTNVSWRIASLASAVGFNLHDVYIMVLRLMIPAVERAIPILSEHNPFLILSTGRTGTTWLANTLNQAQGACVMHEPVPSEQYDHAQALMRPEVAEQYLTDFRLGEMALRCLMKTPLVYGEVNSALRRHGSAFRKLVPRMRIIHLVRDGRDVVRSKMTRTAFTQHDPYYRDLVPPAVDIERLKWCTMNRFEKVCWMWAYDNSYLRKEADYTVKFEDVITSFNYFESRILDPLGLQLDQRVWEARRRNPENKNKGPQYAGWSQWSDAERDTFVELCGKEMCQYEYSLDEK